MKIRICERYQRNSSIGESDIYRKFSKEFEKMFHTGDVAKDKEGFEKLYVKDPDFEQQIELFRESEVSLTKFCVGYTGIGKTTGIRHCFDLGISREASFDLKRGEIIFPTFLDGIRKKQNQFNLANRISAVCSKMERLFPDLRQYMKTNNGKCEFFDFIDDHTSFVLENENPVETMDMDDQELIKEKLKSAYEQNPFEYQANRLKFYIKKKYSIFTQLTIILDDIESLPHLFQKEIVEEFLKLKECMMNTDFPSDREYRVKLLVSIRPHTLRLFRNSRVIETFCIDEPPILKKDSVDLSILFLKRFNYYKDILRNSVGNADTWNECYQTLCVMNNQFEDKYKTMIKNLCFLNVREALSTYARIFANRLWVQKGKAKEESFTITLSDYQFNNINVIRALACNEENAFWGDQSVCVPNIFDTSKDFDHSIHCLLVLEYFRRKRNGEVYGLNASKLGQIYNEWSSVLEESAVSEMKMALEYLFEHHILRKSINDFDEFKTMDLKESLHDDSRLYISPRGEELLEMFKRDSVLLEMLREAAWREYDNRSNYSQKGSNELMLQRKQDEIFLDLLEYIGYLCEKEDDVLSSLTNREEYENMFGTVPLVSYLLEGVKNSLDYSGYINYYNIRLLYEEVKSQIDDLYY